VQCNNSCSRTSKCFCVEKTPVQFSCYEWRSIRKGASERRGTGELCGIIIVVSPPKNVFIVRARACRIATS